MGIGSLYGQGQPAAGAAGTPGANPANATSSSYMNRGIGSMGKGGKGGGGGQPQVQAPRPGQKGPAPFRGRPDMGGGIGRLYQNFMNQRGQQPPGDFMGRPGMETAGPPTVGVGPTPLSAEQADANFAAGQQPQTFKDRFAAYQAAGGQEGMDPRRAQMEAIREGGRPGPRPGLEGGDYGYGGGAATSAGAPGAAVSAESVNRTKPGYGGRPMGGKGGKGGQGGKGKGGGGGQIMNQYGYK